MIPSASDCRVNAAKRPPPSGMIPPPLASASRYLTITLLSHGARPSSRTGVENLAERILPPQQVRGIVGIGCDDVDAIGEFENGGRDHDRCPEGDVGEDRNISLVGSPRQ